jgi:hypothetical protein
MNKLILVPLVASMAAVIGTMPVSAADQERNLDGRMTYVYEEGASQPGTTPSLITATPARNQKISTACALSVGTCSVGVIGAAAACISDIFDGGASTLACIGILNALEITFGCGSIAVDCGQTTSYQNVAWTSTYVGSSTAGTEVAVTCPGDARIDSMRGYVDTLSTGSTVLSKMEITCTDGSRLYVGENNGSTSAEHSCDTGKLYTGVQARFDSDFIYGFSGICAKATDGSSQEIGGWIGANNTGPGSNANRNCPSGKRMNSLIVRRGTSTDLYAQMIRGFKIGCN